MCVPYVKKKYSNFSVLLMVVGKRPRVTASEKKIFKNVFCSRNFSQMFTYAKKVFLTA